MDQALINERLKQILNFERPSLIEIKEESTSIQRVQPRQEIHIQLNKPGMVWSANPICLDEENTVKGNHT